MLLEYEKVGLLFTDDFHKKKIPINRLLEIGKEEILKVIKVDKKKNYIDLFLKIKNFKKSYLILIFKIKIK